MKPLQQRQVVVAIPVQSGGVQNDVKHLLLQGPSQSPPSASVMLISTVMGCSLTPLTTG